MMVFAVCAAKGGERFPFAVSYGGETNATSVAHFLDAPAGKHGFVLQRHESHRPRELPGA